MKDNHISSGIMVRNYWARDNCFDPVKQLVYYDLNNIQKIIWHNSYFGVIVKGRKYEIPHI